MIIVLFIELVLSKVSPNFTSFNKIIVLVKTV